MKTWYTEPDGGFTSFYQFDPASGKFCRIRLELGRDTIESPDGKFIDEGETKVIIKENYAVGFSPCDDLDIKDTERWRIKDGKLCYDDKPLDIEASEGCHPYDWSNQPGEYVHGGSPVTEQWRFPEDILPAHLTILANDAMIKNKGYNLTVADTDKKVLSAKLKEKVCEITKESDFSKLDNIRLLQIAKGQTRQLGEIALNEQTDIIQSSLKQAASVATEAGHLLEENISSGEVPTPQLENSFVSLETTIDKARLSENPVTVQENISDALNYLKEGIAESHTAHLDDVEKEFLLSEASLINARENLEKMEISQAEYKEQSNASNLDEYLNDESDNEFDAKPVE